MLARLYRVVFATTSHTALRDAQDDILNGLLRAEEQAYSQYQIARQFNVNPATAAKGINLLVNEGILYKKRGLSMHVAVSASEAILDKRRKLFVSEYFSNFMDQAQKLNINREDLKKMIDKHDGGA